MLREPRGLIITHQANYSSLYTVCLQPSVNHIVHRRIFLELQSDGRSTCSTNYHSCHTEPSRWACVVCTVTTELVSRRFQWQGEAMKVQNILLIGQSFEVSTMAVRHVVVTAIADERRAMSASYAIRITTLARSVQQCLWSCGVPSFKLDCDCSKLSKCTCRLVGSGAAL